MADINNAYTMCAVVIHLKKEFQLRLGKPSKSRLDNLNSSYSFSELKVDDDDDIFASSGKQGDVIVKDIQLVLSQQKAQVVVLNGKTSDCYRYFFDCLETLYGISQDDTKAGINYVDYSTTTKVKFEGPIYELFNKSLHSLFESWSDMETKQLINPIPSSSFGEIMQGVIDIEEDYYDKKFNPNSSALVIPGNISFSLWVPRKFGGLSQYQVIINCESMDDFQEDEYFVKSEFPYDAHIKLISQIEKSSANK